MNNDISDPEKLKSLGCKGVSENSKDIEPNFLFIALKGHSHHGIDFIGEALEAGAKFIISDQNLPDTVVIPDDVIVNVHENARQLLPHLTSYFCGSVPQYLIGVTGTNGKTSCSLFATQILRLLKVRCAYLGTLGFDVGSVSSRKNFHSLPPHPDKIIIPPRVSLTSERPLKLHRYLNQTYKKGITHAIIESSSIGLEQYRLDALKFCCAVITSFGKDHITDHGSVENYKKQKMRLFEELLEDEAPIIVGRNLDEWFTESQKYPNILRLNKDFSYKILDQNPNTTELEISLGETSSRVLWQTMPKFQIDNLVTSLAMVFARGFDALDIIASSQLVKGIVGRFETVVSDNLNRRVIVDYAHNEEALRVLLEDTKKIDHNKLYLVIGGGGNRDKARRKGMGEVAKELADYTYITDDSPRNEAPEDIRKDILSNAGDNALEVAGRENAIHKAISNLEENDILIIAGKGNENMEVKGEIRPWDDRSYVVKSWNELYPKKTLPFFNNRVVHFEDLNKIIGKPTIKGEIYNDINGISIDSRTLKKKDLFFALKGPNHDGHKYIYDALQKETSAVVCMDGQNITTPCEKPIFIVKDSLKALWELAEFSARNKISKIIGITGSVGKTSTRQAIELVASQSFRTHSSQGNLNNHFGLPLSLARCPFNTEVGIFEVGIDCHEEMPPMAKILAPDIAVFNSFAPAHTKKLGNIKGVIKAKLQLLEYMKEGASVILPSESPYLENLKEYLLSVLKPYKDKFIVRFVGRGDESDDKILSSKQNQENLDLQLQIGAKQIDLTLHVIGEHWGQNALMALVVSDVLGQDIQYSCQGLRLFSASKGRGCFIRGEKYSLLDHSYNASPLSMTTALESLVSFQEDRGNCFAVLGDMSDLGKDSQKYHCDILNLASSLPIDGVFIVGENFANAVTLCGDNLPKEKFIIHQGSLKALSRLLKTFLQPDDLVMIKGSRSQNLDSLVAMLASK